MALVSFYYRGVVLLQENYNRLTGLVLLFYLILLGQVREFFFYSFEHQDRIQDCRRRYCYWFCL